MCKKSWHTCSGAHSHFARFDGKCINYDDSSSESESEIEDSTTAIIEMPTTKLVTISDKSNDCPRRSFDESILHQSYRVKNITFGKKRRWDSSIKLNDEASATNIEAALMSIIHYGPYSHQLSKRSFTQLNDDSCQLLNDDWTSLPQLRFACAQLLAGAIIINKNNEAVLVNTVEIYNRQRELDVHRETFVNKKGMTALSSLPPIDTKYYHTWVTIMRDTDGSKLVVGTKTLNALITSSLRIDSVHQASIGGVIAHFDLDDSTALTTSVFLDNESIKKANILARTWRRPRRAERRTLGAAATGLSSSSSNSSISSSTGATKTMFSAKVGTSTEVRLPVSLAGADSKGKGVGKTPTKFCIFANDLRSQPYTTFTLYEAPDTGRDSATKIVSKLFYNVANLVHSSTNPTLPKQYVNTLFVKCPDGQIQSILQQIVDLYHEDEYTISILNNHSLNALLTLLASLMSASLVSANKSVAENVKSRVLNGH
ncbi:hypothetical protein BDC45DRAFT_602891 [Circinella umbellata]|nr:hypothetical protein BDC45DRAFT_602891 [Circinella umbellata]